MESERTILLTQLDPTSLGEEKVGKRKREEKERVLEREILPSLYIFRRSVRRIQVRQNAKLIPTARATRGYRYCGVSAILGGRGFLLLDLFVG